MTKTCEVIEVDFLHTFSIFRLRQHHCACSFHSLLFLNEKSRDKRKIDTFMKALLEMLNT